jgi:hypothetical protein
MVELVLQTSLDVTYWLLEKRFGWLAACLVLFGGIALVVLGVALLIWWYP